MFFVSSSEFGTGSSSAFDLGSCASSSALPHTCASFRAEFAQNTKRANIRIISQTANLSPCFLSVLSVVSENGACQHTLSLPTCFRTAPAFSLFGPSQKSLTGLSGPASLFRSEPLAAQEFRNKCPVPSRSSAVGKLPLAAALSPTLQLLYTGLAPVSAVVPSADTGQSLPRRRPQAMHLPDATTL